MTVESSFKESALDFCPHCGGRLDGTRERPLQHETFDDLGHEIVIGEERRGVSRGRWLMLAEMRRRFGRYVPGWVLLEAVPTNKSDRTDHTVAIYVSHLRRNLRGSPFTIATQWGYGYGLFSLSDRRGEK